MAETTSLFAYKVTKKYRDHQIVYPLFSSFLEEKMSSALMALLAGPTGALILIGSFHAAKLRLFSEQTICFHTFFNKKAINPFGYRNLFVLLQSSIG